MAMIAKTTITINSMWFSLRSRSRRSRSKRRCARRRLNSSSLLSKYLLALMGVPSVLSVLLVVWLLYMVLPFSPTRETCPQMGTSNNDYNNYTIFSLKIQILNAHKQMALWKKCDNVLSKEMRKCPKQKIFVLLNDIILIIV